MHTHLSAPVGAHTITGSGDMADRIRGFPWQTTPLGPLASWDPVLLSTVNMILALRYPVQVLWGPHRVLLYNDLWVPILMDRHPEALGQPAEVFWAAAWPFVGDEVDGVFRNGVATEHFEEMIPVLRNGVVEEVWWDYTYNPVFGLDGRVAGMLNISKDVTQQRNAEIERERSDEALRAKQAELELAYAQLHGERARLLSVIQQAPVFFALLEGPEHRIAMVNQLYRKLIGHREVLGRTVAEALPEADAQGYVELLDRVVQTGETYEGRGTVFTIAREEGGEPEQRILDLTYQPLREPDGTIGGVIAIGLDITDTKKAERALVQNEKLAAVGRLAASIAHEINNPLEAVTNLLYLARGSSQAEQEQYLDLADQELRRVSAIANQTLRFHKQATRAVSVSADLLLESVLHIYAGRMANALVELKQRMRARHAIRCFDGEVRQVLSNLVGNAIDAMASSGGGSLHLRTRDSRHWKTGEKGIVLTVADTGPGMSRATLAKVFEPFFTTKGTAGTGLGLWISREIVERHGGTLTVRTSQSSSCPGTVFTLFLPREPSSLSSASPLQRLVE